MKSGRPYILFCAGEDSGDCLGEPLVRAAKEILAESMDLMGTGGARMECAGLKPVLDYNDLPVSGFGDVFPRLFKLKKDYNILAHALVNPLCSGLVAIDYPGFNMKLASLAAGLNKPVLYVAPPQVWAWKSSRAQKLKAPLDTLAVFFDFEEPPYRDAGCNVVRMRHPLVTAAESFKAQNIKLQEGSLLLLPGSRQSQASRNLGLYLRCGECLNSPNIVILASRENLREYFLRELSHRYGGRVPANIRVDLSPQNVSERFCLYRKFDMILTTPGTSTLEIALSGCRGVVATCPDLLTYCVGKRFVHTRWFALPNLILGRDSFQEHIHARWDESSIGRVVDALKECSKKSLDENLGMELQKKLSVGKNPEELMSEFLAQLL